MVFDIRPWNIHDEDAAAASLQPLGLGAILSVQRVGVELTVSWVRTDRPCGYDANRILSYFGCHVTDLNRSSTVMTGPETLLSLMRRQADMLSSQLYAGLIHAVSSVTQSVKFYDAARNSGTDTTSSEWSVCFAVFLLLLLRLLRLDAWWLIVVSALDCFRLQVRFAH